MGNRMLFSSLFLLALINVTLASTGRRNIEQAVQNRVRVPLGTAEPTEEERREFAELPHHFRLDDPNLYGRLRLMAFRSRAGLPAAPRERRFNFPTYEREPLEWDSKSRSSSRTLSGSTRSSEEAAYQQAKWDTRAKSSMMFRSKARSGSSN